MGMYTGLRCKVIIKEEYREMIEEIMERDLEWSDFVDEFDFLSEYAQMSRASFIPFGSLAYMPDEWELNPNDYACDKATEGFDREFNKETGYWAFQCSLKNYESEIETFLDTVLSVIAEKVIHLEKHYEEWASSEGYDLVNGKIEFVKPEFVIYRPEDDWKTTWYL